MIEKYSWRGVNKDISPEAILPGGQRALTPGTAFEIVNGRVIADVDGAFQAILPIKGTSTVNTSSYPTGTNTVVASVEDKQNNRLILLVYNSNGSNRIYSLNLETNVLTTITTSDTFDFSSKITSLNIIENNLTWAVDSGEQRHIDLDNIPDPITVKNTSLYKAAGLSEVTVGDGNDATILVNKIAGNSFQFTYRFVYNNDAVSLLAPFSTSYWTNPKPDIYDTSADNYLTVRVAVPVELRDIVKRLEYFTRVNGAPEWYFIGSKDSPTDAGANQITFTNNFLGFTLSANEERPNELIPKSNVQSVFRDRLFTTMASEGLDVNGDWSATVTREFLTQKTGLQWKGSSVHSLGIMFRDDYGRKTLVKHVGDIAPYIIVAESGSYTDVNDTFYYPKVVITGTPPSWAKTWSFCVSRNKFHGTYFQFPGNILFYQFDEADLPAGETISSSNFVSKGYVYSKSRPSTFTGLLHIQMPINMPFTPEVGMYVRFLSSALFTRKPERIRAIVEDRIVIGNFSEGADAVNWSSVNGTQLFEVFSIQENAGDDIFYETQVYDTSLGFSGTYYPQGDTHIVTSGTETLMKYQGLAIDGATVDDEYDYDLIDYNSTMIKASSSFRIESPVPLFALGDLVSSAPVFDLAAGYGYVKSQGSKTYILDYSKTTNNFGAPFIEQKENPILNEPNAIVYSDVFSTGSNVNGMHNYSSDNVYRLPKELSDVVKYQPVGANTLLAIHEREVTSLLIGKGYIKQGEDFILSKTVGVIGDDNNLLGGYGTVHPTSVARIDGYCFFFDVNKKAVVRYASNGLFPVSEYGMESYFITKAGQYYGQTADITGWIDRQNKEYVIHFPAISGVTAETWGFNYKHNIWTSRYELTVDHAASALDTFFSATGNGLYRHNANTNYNQIQGSDKEFILKFYVNPEVSKTKRFINLDLHEEDFMSATSDYKIVRIFSPHNQETYLRAPMFEEKEHTQYAKVLRDINSTNLPSGTIAIRHGKEMRDKYFEVWIQTDTVGSLWKLYGLTTVMVESGFAR